MSRSLSITRRKLGLIDCSLPVRSGVASYSFDWATNFDAAYATFQNVPANGMVTRSVFDVSGGICSDSQFRGKTRFAFSPADYGIPDLSDIWLKIRPINFDGSLGAYEAGQLVLPYSSQPNRPVILYGNAPNVATQALALEIQLPSQVINPQFQNNSSNDLFVSFDLNGTEFRIRPATTVQALPSMVYGSFSQLFVRGSGAVVQFSMTSSMLNNKL